MRYGILEMNVRRKQELWGSRKTLNNTIFVLKAGLLPQWSSILHIIMLTCCHKSPPLKILHIKKVLIYSKKAKI